MYEVPTRLVCQPSTFSDGMPSSFEQRAKEIVAKLNAALKDALNDPATRTRIEGLGAIPPQPAEASPEWMDAFLRSQASLWGKAVKASGLSLD
jgi:tripartite-type tricarboxylate transporter receptor subunit TctC